MKAFVIGLSLFINATVAYSQEQGFYRQLPSITETNKLTAEMFKRADAVILLKETVYGERTRTLMDWAFTAKGEWTVTTGILIAKLFNQNAIEHFGSFEYEFADYSELYKMLKVKAEFVFRARVMKPDSSVWIMPDSSVSTINSVSTDDDSPILRKVLFKIPNLAKDDVVQLEYTHMQPFSDHTKRIFHYHSEYPILYSNLSIFVSRNDKFDFLSFPSDRVGKPIITETDKGWLYCWGVRNLGAVPKEAFTKPFADVSYLTAIVKKPEEGEDGWKSEVKNFLKDHVNRGSVSKSFVEEIGLQASDDKPTWEEVDKTYAALRKHFKLYSINSVYPRSRLDDIIEARAGDASDMALIMMKILKRKGISSTPILIRDRREGGYERTVSTIGWFDRMGLLIALDGGEKVFDFDQSISAEYEYPWFLHRSTVMALYDTGVSHLYVELPLNIKDRISKEEHHIKLNESKATDSVTFSFKAAHAQRLRAQLYNLSGQRLTNQLSDILESAALRSADTVFTNNFRTTRELCIAGKGVAQATVNTIDSFLIFSPKNHLLRKLRGKFSSKERFGHIYFDEPFCYLMEWHVDIPPGYVAAPIFEPVAFEMESGITSHVTYNTEANTLIIQADVIVGTDLVQAEKCPQLIEFLDKTMQTTERDVTFMRKP